MRKQKPKLLHQFSWLAIVALATIMALAFLDFWDRSRSNAIMKEQEQLLLLKKKLANIELETLLARLEESQAIASRKSSYFQNFETRMQSIHTLSTDLILTYKQKDPEVTKTMEIGLQIQEKYRASARNIFALQKKMGLGKTTGILSELQRVKESLQVKLEQVNNPVLKFEFAHMQLYEKDFSSTLDMRLSAKLLSQTTELRKAIQKENLPPQLEESLLSEIERYRYLVSKLLENTLELELVIAESTLHYNRIAPNLAENQKKVDRLLSLSTQTLRKQQRNSALQAIFIFSSAIAILLILMFFQIRSAQTLIARLQKLAEGMREIAAGKFEGATGKDLAAEIVALPQGGDEVGVLAENFLAMSSQIQTQIATIERERENAEAANRAKSQFLASMSHELRTPLNAILGFAQLMGRELSLAPEQEEHLGIIQRSGEHLLELINDILDMSKIEAGRASLNEHLFDLHRLLDTLEEMLGLKASSKGLQLNFERDRSLPQYVKADEGKLRQVLINLLGNGIKFTKKGQVILRVKNSEFRVQNSELINAQCSMLNEESPQSPNLPISPIPHLPNSPYPDSPLPTPHSLYFEVEDTGPGITAEEIGSLFEAFTQTETGRNSGQGTGLGLPICQRFVALMGGEIQVRSVVGRGTIVRFSIPAQPFDEFGIEENLLGREAHQKLAAKPIALAAGQPTYRILVVEDTPDSRTLLRKLLLAVGFEVKEAVNGREAIVLWESWQPHLIWMDIQMPEMDGCEATRQIRAREKTEVPVAIIALTASAFSEEKAEILAAGCDDFLSKPFQEATLFAKMEEYLGLHYIYAEPLSEASARQDPEAIAPADLFAMSVEWIASLHQAALEADTERIEVLIEEIPESQSAIAQVLAKWVYNFQCDRIITLIESAKTEVELP